MPNRSKLVRIRIKNIGCIGPAGLVLELDEIVCLVGPNNAGKSTVLRAYEAAVNAEPLTASEFHKNTTEKPEVELWIHVPESTPNIDEKWKETEGNLFLVRSKWTWDEAGVKPRRQTWDPIAGQYAEDGKAAGLDNVFKSRLFATGGLMAAATEITWPDTEPVIIYNPLGLPWNPFATGGSLIDNVIDTVGRFVPSPFENNYLHPQDKAKLEGLCRQHRPGFTTPSRVLKNPIVPSCN